MTNRDDELVLVSWKSLLLFIGSIIFAVLSVVAQFKLITNKYIFVSLLVLVGSILTIRELYKFTITSICKDNNITEQDLR